MENKQITLQQALGDIRAVREILEIKARRNGVGLSASSKTAATLLQSIAAIASGIFLGWELYEPINTRYLMLSAYDADFRLWGVVSLAGLALAGIAILYLILREAASKEGEAPDVYIARNFKTLSIFSFVSDLAVKFAVISFVIMAKRPELVAPALTLFTADYLLQGRFFHLPVKISAVLGVIGLVGSFIQLSGGNPSLIPSLGFFTGVALLSTVLVASRKIDSGGIETLGQEKAV